MKAKFGFDDVEVWKVTRDEAPETWVQALLDKHQLVWKKDNSGIYIRPENGIKNMNTISQIAVSASFGSIATTAVRAYIGQYLVKRDDGELRAVDEKHFAKEYKIID